MKRFTNRNKILFIFCLLVSMIRCEEADKNHQYIPPEALEITHPNDKYLYENEGKSIFEKYGTTIRWRWRDIFVKNNEYAIPVRESVVIPLTRLFEYLWISPYIAGAENVKEGEAFMNTSLPFEIIYVGSPPYDIGGKSGQFAHAIGSFRIVFYSVNDYDSYSSDLYIKTAYHEFTHILEARYGTPTSFPLISPYYVSNFYSITKPEAVALGTVSRYGASSSVEDLAELVSTFLMTDSVDFNKAYIHPTECKDLQATSQEFCEKINRGRFLIKQKLDLILKYYKDVIGIDLLKVRAEAQNRMEHLRKYPNQIPEIE